MSALWEAVDRRRRKSGGGDSCKWSHITQKKVDSSIINLDLFTSQSKEEPCWAREMAPWLRALVLLPRGPEFKSQQLHGGSQTSIMGSYALFWWSYALFWCVWIYKYNKSLKKKKRSRAFSNTSQFYQSQPCCHPLPHPSLPKPIYLESKYLYIIFFWLHSRIVVLWEKSFCDWHNKISLKIANILRDFTCN